MAMACGMTMVMAAQTPSQPQTPPRPAAPTTQPGTDMAKTMTLSGCLRNESMGSGMSGGTGTTGTTGTGTMEKGGAMGSGWMLTNAKMGGAMGGSGTTGTGTMDKPMDKGMGMTASSYRVTGMSDDELKKHNNHQVELTGMVEGGMSGSGSMAGSGTGTTGSGTGTTGSGTTGTGTMAGQKPMGSAAPAFRATALKMVSATCS